MKFKRLLGFVSVVGAYADGPTLNAAHSGTISPSDPAVGTTITMTCTVSDGGPDSATVGQSFDVTLLYLDRHVLVMDIPIGPDNLFTWTFERAD